MNKKLREYLEAGINAMIVNEDSTAAKQAFQQYFNLKASLILEGDSEHVCDDECDDECEYKDKGDMEDDEKVIDMDDENSDFESGEDEYKHKDEDKMSMMPSRKRGSMMKDEE